MTLLPTAQGCKGEFTGPYPCETGYDSCVNPERNSCETEVTSNGAYCGSCDKKCETGALCADSKCQQAPLKMASLEAGSTPHIAVNNTGVYWPSAYQTDILGVPLTGGARSTIASNVNTCGSSSPAFALTDNSVYYWSNGTTCSSSPTNCSGLINLLLPSGTPSLLAPLSNAACSVGMALDSAHLYWAAQQNDTTSIMSASLKDGTISTLGSFKGNINLGLVATDKQILFGFNNNGPMQLGAVPISGTTNGPTKIVTTIAGKSNGFSLFTANNAFVFLASGGCPCNGNDGQGVLPTSSIDRFPIQGGEGTNIARFSGLVNSMVLDATSVFWATDSTVWKAPIAGGTAVRIADNLAAGATPFLCDNSCGVPNISAVSIAVDSQYVYIADTSNNVNAIFRAKK